MMGMKQKPQILGTRRKTARPAWPSAAAWRRRGWLPMVAVVGALMLSACGQKGPLYLPPPPNTASNSNTSTTTP
jgi:predicted small lipoprotein YifL